MLLLLIFASCEKDNFDQKEKSDLNLQPKDLSVSAINAKYDNGRLVFATQSAFDQTISNLKNSNESQKIDAFADFYKEGFIPAYPHYEKEEGENVISFLEEKKKYIPKQYQNKELELSDILIASDLFASFLNVKREIVIGNELYKYTFSGLLKTELKYEKELDSYVSSHNLYNAIPDPHTLPPGDTPVNDHIHLWVSPGTSDPGYNPCGGIEPINLNLQAGPIGQDNPANPILNDNYPCPPFGGGVPSNGSSAHTQSLINYITNMEPCDYQDAGIFGGWTPFGPRKECIEKFSDGKRQTQTLYSNQDYWVYKEISVKAKHRKHHRTTAFGITIASWWASKKTDEVALVVHDATFEITKPNQVASTPDFTVPSTPVNSRMTFYTEGYMIHGSGAPSGVAFTISQDRYPSTPFDEDVIVQFYNDYVSLNQSMDITVDDVSDIFWDQVYDQVRQTYHSYKGRDPKTITMLMATPQSTIVHYVDLRRRETNVKKVKDILAYD